MTFHPNINFLKYIWKGSEFSCSILKAHLSWNSGGFHDPHPTPTPKGLFWATLFLHIISRYLWTLSVSWCNLIGNKASPSWTKISNHGFLRKNYFSSSIVSPRSWTMSERVHYIGTVKLMNKNGANYHGGLTPHHERLFLLSQFCCSVWRSF